ncbi:hypothetical protein GTW69_22765, partial [Streptomyces sp. SID7760]|nr:hypothetical protein [Streptomyces sp. SID7760]
MNRASTRRLLVVPVLLWAALSATSAVADSSAYATIDTGDGAGAPGLVATAGTGATASVRGGGHHGGGPPVGWGDGHGIGHGHDPGHGH